jgi:hypothetical protein
VTTLIMFGLLVAGGLLLAWLRRTPWLDEDGDQ